MLASAPDLTQAPSNRVGADQNLVQVPAETKPKPRAEGSQGMVLWLAGEAETLPAWGTAPVARDQALREFWPKENILASAICSQAARFAAFPWELEGPTRTQAMYRRILHSCEHGEGWQALWLKTCIDLTTQDNGAFVGIERAEDDPASPMVGLEHLDASRCKRTGNWDYPVIYWSRDGKAHVLKWYQVWAMAEMPSPVEAHNGRQMCVVSRVLKAAQIMRDIHVYKQEKLGGQWDAELHVVSGVGTELLEETINNRREDQRAQGLTRYVRAAILGTMDPTANLKHEVINLAGLPDNFDEEVWMKWYITMLALAFLDEYQSFAPLPGGNLGTAQQSQVLAQKASSKGPAQFMSMVEYTMNFGGLLPNTLKFKFGGKDSADDERKTQLAWRRAQMYKLYNEILVPLPVILQIMRDNGDLKPEYLALAGIRADITPQPLQSSGV